MTQKDRWEDLLYSGTNTLRNIQGIQDEDSWQHIEGILTSTREASLPQFGFDGSLQEQLCQTHAYLFQDCYEWAGSLHTFDMSIPVASRPGETHTFADYTTIEARLNELDDAVAALDDASYEDKIEVLAYLHSELNEIHPFREGNGRSTRAFIETTAARHDIALSWEGHIDQLHRASVESMSGNQLSYQPFHRLYQTICHEATFDDSADQSIFDVLDSNKETRTIDPLAFAQDAFPQGLSHALATGHGTEYDREQSASTELCAADQYGPEQSY